MRPFGETGVIPMFPQGSPPPRLGPVFPRCKFNFKAATQVCLTSGWVKSVGHIVFISF